MSLGNPFLYALMFEGGGEEAVTPEAEEEEGTERAPLCDSWASRSTGKTPYKGGI